MNFLEFSAGGYLFSTEKMTCQYDASSHLVKSNVETFQVGRQEQGGAGMFLNRRFNTETEYLKYSAAGQVLRQKTTQCEAGGCAVTESLSDNLYDRQGRLVRSHTRTTSEAGEVSETEWQALKMDAAGRVLRHESVIRSADGTTVRQWSLEDSRCDGAGRLVYEKTAVEETGTDGVVRGSMKEQWFLGYNAFGQVVRRETVLHRPGPEGDVRRTKETEEFRYDARGRTARTTITGVENIGGRERTYSSILEIFKFDDKGRACRTRSVQERDGVRSTRTSLNDIVYDDPGRVIESRDRVETSGLGLAKIVVESYADIVYDAWGRRLQYTRATEDGALSVVEKVERVDYDAWDRVTAMLSLTTEFSRDPAAPLFRQTHTSLVGMRYDRRDDLVGYEKTMQDGDGVTHFHPVSLQYDEQGRLVESLVRVVSDDGRDFFEWSYGLAYNALGQMTDGWQGTLEMRDGGVPGENVLERMKSWGSVHVGLFGRSRGAVMSARERDDGVKNVAMTRLSNLRYDAQGRLIHSESVRYSMTRNVKGVVIEEHLTRGRTEQRAFDSLGRAVRSIEETWQNGEYRTVVAYVGYDIQGRQTHRRDFVSISGVNGDGSRLQRSYVQEQSFEFGALGRPQTITTRLRHDTAAPLKDETTVVSGIVYDAVGRRIAWTETSVSGGAPEKTLILNVSNAQYDNAGRLVGADQTKYEEAGGNRRLLYADTGVVNAYDIRGRFVESTAERSWNESGSGGGEVAGLDDGWATGRVRVKTVYVYAGVGDSLISSRTEAHGTGAHSNALLTPGGIQLMYEQKDIKYDESGRMTTYRQIVTQRESYTFQKEVQKGLRKKKKSGLRLESVTTDTYVTDIQYDGFGRQGHSVSVSQRNDVGRTQTTTVSTVKSFDGLGRAKDVERVTDSRFTLPKKRGGFFQRLGTAVIPGGGLIGGTVLALRKGDLVGGKEVQSYSHVTQTLAYSANGTVDDVRTQTITLKEFVKDKGKNWGDRVLQAGDIVVAVGATVATVATAGAASPLAAMAWAVAIGGTQMAYQGARQGVAINDFEAHADREQAHASRMMAANFAVTVFMVGVGDNVAASTTFGTTAGTLNTTGRIVYAGMKLVLSAGVAVAGGADRKTILKVVAISTVSGMLESLMVSAGDGRGNVWLSGGGELVRQIGMTYGDEKQRSMWMILGSAMQSSAGGSTSAAWSILRIALIDAFARGRATQDGEELEMRRRGMVAQAWSELVGNMVSMGQMYWSAKAARISSGLTKGGAAEVVKSEAAESLFEQLKPFFERETEVSLPRGLRPLKVHGYIVGEVYASAKASLWNMMTETVTDAVEDGTEWTSAVTKNAGENVVTAVTRTTDKATEVAGAVKGKAVIAAKSTKTTSKEVYKYVEQKTLKVGHKAWEIKCDAAGKAISILDGDAYDQQPAVIFPSDPDMLALISGNGMLNSMDDAIAMSKLVGTSFWGEGGTSAFIRNDHGWLIGDIIQSIGHEVLGAKDKPAQEMLKAIRLGIAEKGIVFVVCHSQGSAYFHQAIRHLEPEERKRVHYLGLGPEWIVDVEKEGLGSALNVVNKDDIVPRIMQNGAMNAINRAIPDRRGRMQTEELIRRGNLIINRKPDGVGSPHYLRNYVGAINEWAKDMREIWDDYRRTK
ncbi:MAG TPA: hypothetical protein P5079_02470 [Elusimicrobiota bacterium]|nr:hypothetical protein [Elusimicrobiota bacterium]